MDPHGNGLTIIETDEADHPIASYVYSEQNVPPAKQAAPIAGRVDVMVCLLVAPIGPTYTPQMPGARRIEQRHVVMIAMGILLGDS